MWDHVSVLSFWGFLPPHDSPLISGFRVGQASGKSLESFIQSNVTLPVDFIIFMVAFIAQMPVDYWMNDKTPTVWKD
jgi:hypothetical protein